jgi:Major Facilitator Superfamily
VVAAAFAITFVGFGSAYAFSAFVGSLQQDFGASRGSVSLVFSLAGFLYFGLGIVTGPLADRWGSRRLAIIGMLVTGIGLALASTARILTEGLSGLRHRRRGRGRLRLRSVPGRGAALVHQTPRVCVRFRGQRDRRRHTRHASAGVVLHCGAGLAQCLPGSRASGRRRRRRDGARDRERSARARPGSGQRSAPIGRFISAVGRCLLGRSDQIPAVRPSVSMPPA